MHHKKVILLGDGGTGKTCFGLTLEYGQFPADYVPPTFESVTFSYVKDGVDWSLYFWDTPGNEELDRLRPLSYPQTDLFVILYSVVNLTSFDNITAKWVPEITLHMPGTPWILVASKTDLRDQQETVKRFQESYHRDPITTEEGQALASLRGAASFVEVSSLTNHGLQEAKKQMVNAATTADNAATQDGKRRDLPRNVLCVLL